jgi:hypothetical protein
MFIGFFKIFCRVRDQHSRWEYPRLYGQVLTSAGTLELCHSRKYSTRAFEALEENTKPKLLNRSWKYSNRVFEALVGNTSPKLLKRLGKYSTHLVDARSWCYWLCGPGYRVYFRYDVMAQPRVSGAVKVNNNWLMVGEHLALSGVIRSMWKQVVPRTQSTQT